MLPQLEAQAKAANAPVETLIALGAAYVDSKRYADAIPWLKKGIAASKAPDPSWKRALLSALLSTGNDAEALPLLEDAVRKDPRDREAWLQLCGVVLKRGPKEKALGYLELAQRLGYLDSPVDRLRLINLTAQLGAPFEAASLMQGWLSQSQLEPNLANKKLLANLWLLSREKRFALGALESVADEAPSAEIYQTQAQLLMERQDYGSAAQALERAIALGAKGGQVPLNLAMARYQTGDVDGAASAFRDAARDAKTKKTAEEWLKYLQNNEARSQAMAAARERQLAAEDSTTLSSRLLGGAVELAAPVTASVAGSPAVRGGELTPVGAERGANADGSIPAWTGGFSRSETPAAFKPGLRIVDPFPNDKPVFTITAANADQYREQLSPGHRAMLKKYPSYQMPVYETRRSANYPQAIYDASQLNIGKAKLLGSDSLEGARLGFPFPKPASGVEIMWNHRTRYRGDTVSATYTQAAVAADGEARSRNKQTFRVYFRYGNVADPVDIAEKNILLYGITSISENGRSPEFVALFHEPSDSAKNPRNIWVLLTKIGKMLRIPPIGYDQPFPASEGLEFIDMVDMYNGAFDRYVWKLIGKRELFIPYNSYRMADGSLKNNELLRVNHLNPQSARYERHRVWVIEATERGGKRHVFGKRTFYVDEDSWNISLVENADRDGRLWRFQEGHLMQMYDCPCVTAVPTVTYDLKDGRYFANRLFSDDRWFVYGQGMTDAEFLPARVRAQYGR